MKYFHNIYGWSRWNIVGYELYIDENEPFNDAKYHTTGVSTLDVSSMAEQTQDDEGEDQVYHQPRNDIPNCTRNRFEKTIKTWFWIGVLFKA